MLLYVSLPQMTVATIILTILLPDDVIASHWLRSGIKDLSGYHVGQALGVIDQTQNYNNLANTISPCVSPT